MDWKGIILAGGTGSRLHPVTRVISKHLLPIYNKPMIYYPLSVLMLAKIRDILIISSPQFIDSFKDLLGDGSNFGINLSYETQENPDGIAQAFSIGEEFISKSNVCLTLGDNIFYGDGLKKQLDNAMIRNEGATIFGYQVKDPERFGVVELDEDSNVISLEEKPQRPKSNIAVTGLYFYDNNIVNLSKKINISNNGELEITSINQIYLENKKLNIELFGRGFAWLDTGTHESLMDASHFIEVVENRQGVKIACLEEIGFNNKWISKNQVLESAKKLDNTSYGKYLKKIIELH